MRICLYSPYLPQHFGGGEKYLLDVAQVLATKHTVTIAVKEVTNANDNLARIKAEYQSFFQIDLSRVNFISTPLGSTANAVQKLLWTAKFDVIYYLTDGSLFFSLANKNILHIQIPFTQAKTGLLDRIKLMNWSVKNTNSNFTKGVVEKAWHTHINEVHSPMVEVAKNLTFSQLQPKKQKIILNVGRFFRQLHTKRQDVLVKAFQQLHQNQPQAMKDWKLVFVGVVEDQDYAHEIHQLAQDLPIEFYHQLKRDELLELYQQAAIYWHAAGYGVDPIQHPEKMEHFGISTVEAMAYGAAPVVIGLGGQPEILSQELKDWLWLTLEECQAKTLDLISQPALLTSVQEKAMLRAQHFDRAAFTETLWRMIGN